MRTITLCMALGALSCLTNSAHSNDIPEGKIYSYKEEDGITREMEIHFPRDHDPSTESVPGIIMFHGGGWGGGEEGPISLLMQLLCTPRTSGSHRIVSTGNKDV